jgi:hypothetical protein
MSTANEVLNELLQIITQTHEAHTLLLQKLNERMDLLEKRVSELQTAGGPCYRCGRTGHWASTCYAAKDVYGNDLESDDSGYDSR